MNKAHKIKLNPTKHQKIFFEKSFGTARFCFNWALNKWQEDYKNGIKQSAYSLIKHLNSIKKEEFHWMQEVGKCCGQYAIHNLNVKAMGKNRKLSQAINDVGFGEFRRQLEYKSKWYGSEVIVADRFYASSKICSCCGNKKDKLKLSERVYECYVCGNKLDRDLNASKNLANLALLGNPEEVKPSGADPSTVIGGVAMKQESLFFNILNN